MIGTTDYKVIKGCIFANNNKNTLIFFSVSMRNYMHAHALELEFYNIFQFSIFPANVPLSDITIYGDKDTYRQKPKNSFNNNYTSKSAKIKMSTVSSPF